MVFIWVRFQTRFLFVCGCSALCTCRHKLFNCLFEIFHFWEHRSHKIWAKRLDFSPHSFGTFHNTHTHTLMPYRKTIFGKPEEMSATPSERQSLSVHKILMEKHTENFGRNDFLARISLPQLHRVAQHVILHADFFLLSLSLVSFYFKLVGSLLCAYIFSFTYPFVREAFFFLLLR